VIRDLADLVSSNLANELMTLTTKSKV